MGSPHDRPVLPAVTGDLLVSQPTDDAFIVTTEVRGDRSLVRLVGELDVHVEHHAREALLLLAKHGIRHFMLDATDLTYVGASGIHIITDLFAAEPLSVVTLIGASPTYLKLLSLTGLDAHLALVDPR